MHSIEMQPEFRSERMFDRVADHLRKHVRASMRPGDCLPGIHVLARQLKVSQWTLRSAQALLAREGVLEVRHGSGVFVAKPLPCFVGIYTALDILQPRTSSFHTLAPYALRRYLDGQRIESDLYIGRGGIEDREQAPSNPRLIADVAAGRLRGLVVLNASETAGWADWVANLPIPVVGTSTPYQVDRGYGRMVEEGVKRLYAQGRRRMAMLSWTHNGLCEALEKTLEALGLERRPEWVLDRFHPMLPGAGWEEFRQIWSAHREKPDGLLVTDDLLFQEAVLAIQELGIRVPDDLAIVTHANQGAPRRYPFPVTEFLCDPEQFAAELGGMLLKLMRGEPVLPAPAADQFKIVETGPAGVTTSRHKLRRNICT